MFSEQVCTPGITKNIKVSRLDHDNENVNKNFDCSGGQNETSAEEGQAAELQRSKFLGKKATFFLILCRANIFYAYPISSNRFSVSENRCWLQLS